MPATPELESNNATQAAAERPVYFFKTRIAGKNIEIECLNRQVAKAFSGYFADFEQPDFVIEADQTAVDEAIQSTVNTQKAEAQDAEAIAIESPEAEMAVILRKVADSLVDYGILLMHGAAIAVGERCYIFTAPSGTGKTTHAMNWLKAIPGAYIVNGDKPFVDVNNKLVYGSPWCGKESINTNTSVPLAGIVTLERGEFNSIDRISFHQILPMLLRQLYIPKDSLKARVGYQLISELTDIPCFSLQCNIEQESAAIAYKALQRNFIHRVKS